MVCLRITCFALLFLSLGSSTSYANDTGVPPALTNQAQTLHEAYAQILSKEDSEDTQPSLEQLATRYETMVQSVPPSAHLYYNLGTLYLKLESYGKAIYYLKSAYQLDSSDVRITEHLQRASRQASVALSPPQQGNFQGWVNGFWESVPSKFWLIHFFIFSILATIWGVLKRRINGVAVILLVLSFGALGLGVARQQHMGILQEVVLLNSYNPHTGMGPQYPGIMAGHGLKAGNVGSVLRQDSGWYEVRWYDAQRGWVPAEEIKVVLGGVQ